MVAYSQVKSFNKITYVKAFIHLRYKSQYFFLFCFFVCNKLDKKMCISSRFFPYGYKSAWD